MEEFKQAMAAQSTSLVDNRVEAREFFSRVISPFIDKTKTENRELLEHFMLHMMKDETKSKEAENRKKRRGPEEDEGKEEEDEDEDEDEDEEEDKEEEAVTNAVKGQIFPVNHRLTRASCLEHVIQAILTAKRDKKILRVAGSEHSVSDAIFPKQVKHGVTLLLTEDLRKVEIQEMKEEQGKKWLYCRIGAGCYLGKNPLDCHSDLQNSACYQVAVYGYGFPELAGITHQSVGGFISTGSAGGSLQHSFADVIQEIEFVDGNGTVRIARPGTDLWSAVGVSMGLLGVITHVSFRLPEMGLVEGSESIHKFAESLLGPDEKGHSKLKESLEKNEYMRVNWFPQKYARRVQQYVARQINVGDIIPYKSILSSILAAGMAAISLALCNCLLEKNHPTETDYKIIGTILRAFVSLGPPKRFRDIWFKALPMDNENHTDYIMKMDFTEIWIPLDQCQAVMDKLQGLFENQQACNNLATEIYGAKETPFWLSMSYNQKMVRVDPYWWAYNEGDKRKFFSYFWDVLLDIPGARLHWGKYLPHPRQKCGKTTFNLAYLKRVYPKMDDWLKIREQMDPDQVFLTDYWRGIFEIPAPSNYMRC